MELKSGEQRRPPTAPPETVASLRPHPHGKPHNSCNPVSTSTPACSFLSLASPSTTKLLRKLKITPLTPFAEQDFLNMFFREIYEPIPPIYNLVLAMLCGTRRTLSWKLKFSFLRNYLKFNNY
ncbi:hypothetical protein SLEP1_g32664 [Rubroshorea leprosula]|uniref:Uncharacterized protein n=1 Tax=Rubroshorea leprosula TaxID=152421 RepID=A0AAV5KE68_9ROSI|nr:hypothetical protein SLEP1_g32664 [Rubroshorea leprosula]